VLESPNISHLFSDIKILNVVLLIHFKILPPLTWTYHWKD